MRPFRRVGLVIAALLAAGFPSAARAHPHAWIDLSVEVLFNARGEVHALRQTWLFDDFYTEYALGGPGRTNALPDPERLAALMDENLGNLVEYTYFTKVQSRKAAVVFRPPADRASQMRGRRIEMSFLLPFATPVAVSAEAPLDYQIFDPSYYIEMLHAENGSSIRLVDAPPGCTTRIVQPKPSVNEVARAAALDRNQSGGNTLGLAFAQRVTVQCAARR